MGGDAAYDDGMRTRVSPWVCGVLTAAVLAGPAPAREQDVREAIVKIYTVRNRPNYYHPWSSHGPAQSTGSGCIVSDNRILTNGHVVSDQTFLQIRRNGDARRYEARLLAVSHEADLALLTVDDPAFFAGIEPLEFGGLPNTQEEVLVYGFPLGGDTLSITKGVLSRIEHQTYAHSSCQLLAGQIDAAINPGNSGGPVVVDDRVVGVVMQTISNAENIGYMVPMPVVEHFLADIGDGRYENFPSLGVLLQDMENPTLRAKYRMGSEQSGVLITRILPGSPSEGILEAGDVLLEVDGEPVANDGTIAFRHRQRTQVSYLVQRRQVDEPLDLRILRDGETRPATVVLDRPLTEDWLVPMEQYDTLPSYFIYGGVVFCPLTRNLLREWGNNWYNSAPKEFVALLGRNYREPDRDEVVIVLKVLAADANQGYHDLSHWTVERVNGQTVRNLAHLAALVEDEASTGPYVEFIGESGQQLVLDRKQVAAENSRILELYRIGSDRSPDLALAAPADGDRRAADLHRTRSGDRS